MNVQPLLWIDTFALAASLPARMGAFKPGIPRVINLRGCRKDTLPEEADYVWYQASAKWIELRNLVAKIGRGLPATGPLDIGTVVVEMLDPDTATDWLKRAVVPGWTTLRVALRSNPAVMLHYGWEPLSPAVGMVNAVNPAAPHCSINLGETPAITLEVTVRPKATPEAA